MKIIYCNKELITSHIAEALVMGGLPMSTTTENLAADIPALAATLARLTQVGPAGQFIRLEEHLRRGPKLGQAKAGSGHDCFLKGIIVTAVISAPSYQWPQIQRYHFLDIISSQSKMHRLTQMDLRSQCNAEVDEDIINLLNSWIDEYNDFQAKIRLEKDLQATRRELHGDSFIPSDSERLKIKTLQAESHKLFRKILNNTPQGLHLAAGIVTNYLQLKTMKLQRKNHDLEEWSDDFVAWVDGLPYFKEFTEK